MGLRRYWVQIPPLKLFIYYYVFYIWNKWVIKVIRRLIGAEAKFDNIRSGKETQYVAEVSKVLVHPHLAFGYASHRNYLCWPVGFITWSQLLDRNVSLLSLSYTDQLAAFAILDESEQIFDARKHPFMWVSQSVLSKEIVTIPLNVFHKLVDSVDVSSKTVVFMPHVLRCGSTLWSQVFNALPGWVCISENQPMADVFFNEVADSETFKSSKDYENMIKSLVKFHILRFSEKEGIFIKAALGDFFATEAIAKSFPKSKILFAYRNPLGGARSIHRVMNNFDFYSYFADIISEIPDTNNRLANDFKAWFHFNMKPFHDILVKEKPQCIAELYMLLWSQVVTLALKALEAGACVKGVKYEALLDKKEETIAKVFEYVGVDPVHIKTAIDIMERDSQEGSPISQEVTKAASRWQQTSDSLKRCTRMLNAFGFPDVDCNYLFPNDL